MNILDSKGLQVQFATILINDFLKTSIVYIHRNFFNKNFFRWHDNEYMYRGVLLKRGTENGTENGKEWKTEWNGKRNESFEEKQNIWISLIQVLT